MQLASLENDNFKRLDRLALSFLQQDGTPRPLTLIAGAGGTGKTTVLQAIALVLSLATWRTASPGAFAWPGFSSVRLSSRGPTRVALTVHFDEDEQAAIGAAYAAWAKRGARGDEALLAMAKPLLAPRVRLVFEDGALHFPDGRGAEGQFLGRSFLRAVHQEDRAALRQTLSTLGDGARSMSVPDRSSSSTRWRCTCTRRSSRPCSPPCGGLPQVVSSLSQLALTLRRRSCRPTTSCAF